MWRRGWDSNPRAGYPTRRFRGAPVTTTSVPLRWRDRERNDLQSYRKRHPSAGDPTAHAEIVAIRAAARRVGNYRLTGAILCVTIEPCLMCVGALVHARIGTLVYGALEPRTGAIISTVRGSELAGHNHRAAIVGGVRDEECRALMQAFFKDRRQRNEGADKSGTEQP